jgi:hypothetical protein
MHSPEPWYEDTHNYRAYIMADGTAIAKVYLNDGSAQRIVACVNACAGIDQETLESTAAPEVMKGRVAGKMRDLKAQRDELLDLLSKIIDGDVGRNTLWKLSTGQGTETAEGKTWLAAQDVVTAVKAYGVEQICHPASTGATPFSKGIQQILPGQSQ